MDQAYMVKSQAHRWAPFLTDNRGCVTSGKIFDFNPPGKKLADFRTLIHSDGWHTSGQAFGMYYAMLPWMWGALKEGIDHVIVLVDGGQYPGCGFYVYAEQPGIEEAVGD